MAWMALAGCGCSSWSQLLSGGHNEDTGPRQSWHEWRSADKDKDNERGKSFAEALDKGLSDLRNLVMQEVGRLKSVSFEEDLIETVEVVPAVSARVSRLRHSSGSRSASPPGSTSTVQQLTPPAPSPGGRTSSSSIVHSKSATHIAAIMAARKKDRAARASNRPGPHETGKNSPRPCFTPPLVDSCTETTEPTDQPVIRFSTVSTLSRTEPIGPSFSQHAQPQLPRNSTHSEKSSPGLYRHSMYEERASVLSMEPAKMWMTDEVPPEKDSNKGYTRFFLSEVTRHQAKERKQGGPVSQLVQRYLMARPTSRLSITWDLFFIFLISFEVIAIPLSLFDLEETTFQTTMTWIARLFWTLSIPKSFCTGYLEIDGELEMDPSKVAIRYARTWLIFDLVIVASDWAEKLGQVSDILSTSRLLRLVRTIRVIKVMRIGRGIRVPSWMTSWSLNFDTETVNLAFGTFKISCSMVAVAHFIACFWYGIGMWGFERQILNWVEENGLLGKSLTKRYSVSLHWAVTQFIGSATVKPMNDDEYIFATSTLVFAFVTSAGFVSSLTNLMTRFSILSGSRAIQFSILTRFLHQRNISTDLTFRIQSAAEYFVAERRNYIPEADVELLQQLTRPLLVEVHYEVFAPVLRWHPLFYSYDLLDKVAFHNICHKAVTQSFNALGDLLFAENERMLEPKMWFIMKGSFVYTSEQLPKADIVPGGAWVCEIGVWSEGWSHLGELRAAQPCIVVQMDASALHAAAHYFTHTADMCRKYADELTRHVNAQMVSHPYTSVVDDIDILDFDVELVATGLYRRFKKRMQTRLATELQELSELEEPQTRRLTPKKTRKMWRIGSVRFPSVQHAASSSGDRDHRHSNTTMLVSPRRSNSSNPASKESPPTHASSSADFSPKNSGGGTRMQI